MPDPTWYTPCPACGFRVSTNQMGQTYPHKGVNGCPYSGNGPLQRQHIYPLKFDFHPVMTATAAYVDDATAATIRYGLEDSKRPAAGEYISMRTAEGDVFGIGEVEKDFDTEYRDAIYTVWESDARHRVDRPETHLEKLNEYYDDEITVNTEVTALVYRPVINSVDRER